jgi:hypothetical protein
MLRRLCTRESKNKGTSLLSESLAMTKLGKHLIMSAVFGTNLVRDNTCTSFVSNSSSRGKDKRKLMRRLWVEKWTFCRWRVLSGDILLIILGISTLIINCFNIRTVSVLQVNMVERKYLSVSRNNISRCRVWILLVCIAVIISLVTSLGSSSVDLK